MDRQVILEKLEESWRALLHTVDEVTTGLMERPGAIGSWSVKDVLGHITTWEEEALKGVEAVARGETWASYGDIDAWNAKAAAAKAGVSLSSILVQLGEMHERLVSRVTAMPAPVLQHPKAEEKLRVDGWAHYDEHRRNLESWLSTLAG